MTPLHSLVLHLTSGFTDEFAPWEPHGGHDPWDIGSADFVAMLGVPITYLLQPSHTPQRDILSCPFYDEACIRLWRAPKSRLIIFSSTTEWAPPRSDNHTNVNISVVIFTMNICHNSFACCFQRGLHFLQFFSLISHDNNFKS